LIWLVNMKQIKSEYFTEAEILTSIENNKILLADLETNLTCNGRCKYCFRGIPLLNKKHIVVPFDLLLNRIDTLKKAGVRTINLIGGGEPLIYYYKGKTCIDIIKFICKNNITVEIFTNGLVLGNTASCKRLFGFTPEEVIKVFYESNVTIFLKCHSLKKDTYNSLIGKNVFEQFITALELLEKSHYYGSNFPQLVIQCTISKTNYSQIKGIWTYANKKHLATSFELVRASGCARINDQSLNSQEARILFEKIADLDKEEKIKKPLIPPYIGYTCDLNKFACYVDVKGDLYNCESMALKFGNISQGDIQEQIAQSKDMQMMRHIDKHIQGSCKKCNYLLDGTCWGGCRGNAHIAGNVFGSDPLCWHISP